MSDLDDLETLAETMSFGYRPYNTGRVAANARPYSETCAKGHVRNDTNVSYRKVRGRPDVVCLVCQREQRRKRNHARRMLRACSKQEPST